jgi:hypothetical protein
VIEYAEMLTEQGLDNRSQIDHKFDHKSITENVDISLVNASKQEPATVSEVDHKDCSGGGECVSALQLVTNSDAFEVGEKVDWVECPGHCENLAPFEITAIDGDYVKLDLFPKPVPMSELRRRS